MTYKFDINSFGCCSVSDHTVVGVCEAGSLVYSGRLSCCCRSSVLVMLLGWWTCLKTPTVSTSEKMQLLF